MIGETILLLGSGTFSDVYMVEKDGKKFALKKVKTPLKSPLKSIFLEFNTTRNFTHPNIVRYLGMNMNSFGSVDFTLEFIDGGTLKEAYQGNNEELLFFWLFQLSLGLSFLQANKIVHRDIKPANILMDKSGIVKISDFGTAKFVEMFDQQSEYVGTPAFIPPELLLKKEYYYESDIWSLGVSFYSLIHNQIPFSKCTSKKQYFKTIIQKSIKCDPLKCSPEMAELLSGMMMRNHEYRFSVEDIMDHPAMANRRIQHQEWYRSCLQNYYEKTGP